MLYILSYENEDISIIDSHVSKEILELKLQNILMNFFATKKIVLKYEELFKESDSYYLVNNDNKSISIYHKSIIPGYIYNSVETREICVYYIKSFDRNDKLKLNLENDFTQYKSKLKKTIVISEKKNDFNIMNELIKDPKFLKIRTFIEPNDT